MGGELTGETEVIVDVRSYCATLTTINQAWPYLTSNPDHRDRKPETNHLSYDTAFSVYIKNRKSSTEGGAILDQLCGC